MAITTESTDDSWDRLTQRPQRSLCVFVILLSVLKSVGQVADLLEGELAKYPCDLSGLCVETLFRALRFNLCGNGVQNSVEIDFRKLAQLTELSELGTSSTCGKPDRVIFHKWEKATDFTDWEKATDFTDWEKATDFTDWEKATDFTDWEKASDYADFTD